MPSNALKISQLIEQLTELQAQHGDLDCVLGLPAQSQTVAIDGRNVGIALELPWQRLPAPALVFGMWQNADGALTNSPGQVYQSDHAPGEWNYTRDVAPRDVELVVWKRYGGQDCGYRTEDGRWFVYERGDKPVEIASQGVLAWRV